MPQEHQPSPPRRPIVHRKATPPPPIVSYEDIIASCGHPEKFGLFEDRKDKFRKDRRAKAMGRPCKACREKRRVEEEKALEARKAEKQKRAQELAAAPARKQASAGTSARLPDGAKVEAVYDATRMQWTGSLSIGETVFTGSAGALFTLLNRLDKLYRKSLPAESPPAPS